MKYEIENVGDFYNVKSTLNFAPTIENFKKLTMDNLTIQHDVRILLPPETIKSIAKTIAVTIIVTWLLRWLISFTKS